MKGSRRTAGVLGLMLLAAPAWSGQAERAIDPDILAAREKAWRAYFDGDTRVLGALLPPEFIGINMNDGPFVDLAAALDGARQFRESGGRLISLAFPATRAQRFGDVVVLYGRFEAVLQSGGAEQALRGRLTEVFVRRNGTWLHPGWHLDLTGPPPPIRQGSGRPRITRIDEPRMTRITIGRGPRLAADPADHDWPRITRITIGRGSHGSRGSSVVCSILMESAESASSSAKWIRVIRVIRG